MSIDRMNMREQEVHRLGLLLIKAVEDLTSDDVSPDTYDHYKWLIRLLEGASDGHTRVDRLLPDPRIPF